MILIRLIIVCQLVFTLTCLIIQMYAIVSSKWAIFESRIELGLVEEHGHYGLWSICTKKFIPAQVTEDGRIIKDITDCEPMNTFYKPNHNRALIAFFAITHFIVMLGYLSLVALRLIELYLYKPNKFMSDVDDLHESQTTKIELFLNNFSRWLFNRTGRPSDENTKKQIRIKLYTISVAAIVTALAVWESMSINQPLRDTDIFQINNVSSKNYRTYRGPGFIAQLISLIIDMLITSLIAIEVRVLLVLQQLEEDEPENNQETTTSYGTSDNIIENDNHTFIINPFFYSDSIDRSSSINEQNKDDCPTPAIPLNENLSRSNNTSNPFNRKYNSDSAQTSLYVNSFEVRKLKKNKPTNMNDETIQPQAGPSNNISYINPIFIEEDHNIP